MAGFGTVTRLFTLIGIASSSYAVYRWLLDKRGEDGPIRVRGSSVTIESKNLDWEKDDHEGKNEYHYRGRPNRWRVRVLKNNEICVGWMEARRVTLTIGSDDMGNDADVVFRANGAVRVLDKENRFVASGKKLTDTSAGARINKVVIGKLNRKEPDEECNFGSKETCQVDLKPLR